MKRKERVARTRVERENPLEKKRRERGAEEYVTLRILVGAPPRVGGMS